MSANTIPDAAAILAERQRTQAVKPLEWEAYPKDETIGEPRAHYGFWVGGHYHVTKAGGIWCVGTFTERGQARHVGCFHTRREAKAAAQADYEARIRSALVEVAILNPPSAASSRAEQTGEAKTLPASPVAHSDWITWNGGDKCPVAYDTLVTVRFRCGDVCERSYAHEWVWSHSGNGHGGGGDVIAYRVVQHD